MNTNNQVLLSPLSVSELRSIISAALAEQIAKLQQPKPPAQGDDLSTPEQVMNHFGISRSLLQSQQKVGKIKVYKLGGKSFYRIKEIAETIAQSRNPFNL